MYPKFILEANAQPLSTSTTATASRGSRRRTRRRATTTAHTHTRALVLNTSLLSVVSSRSNIGILSRINTDSDPSKDTIANIVTQQNVLHEGVDGVGLLSQDAVVGVGGQVLGVCAVGGCLLDGGDEILVEKELAYVRGVCGVEVAEGVVGLDGCVVGGVGEDWLRLLVGFFWV